MATELGRKLGQTFVADRLQRRTSLSAFGRVDVETQNRLERPFAADILATPK
jgi:hypothetical protein